MIETDMLSDVENVVDKTCSCTRESIARGLIVQTWAFIKQTSCAC